ncbi:MAG: hypothetical protein HY078_10470 [Elusimicrobia bacterium]|nr:hypothetical protein [Elusimicrobiota bacterium]
MKKQSMTVEGYKITAWKGADGLMRLEIENLAGRDTISGLNHPWERLGLDGLTERTTFTDNPFIIENETGPMDGKRNTAKFRREAERDATFMAWSNAEASSGSEREKAAAAE